MPRPRASDDVDALAAAGSAGADDAETDGDTDELGLTDDVGVSDRPVVADTDGDADVEREDAGLAEPERDVDAAAEGDTVGEAKVPPRKMMTPAVPFEPAKFRWPPDPGAPGNGVGSGPYTFTPKLLLTKLEPPPPPPAAPLGMPTTEYRALPPPPPPP